MSVSGAARSGRRGGSPSSLPGDPASSCAVRVRRDRGRTAATPCRLQGQTSPGSDRALSARESGARTPSPDSPLGRGAADLSCSPEVSRVRRGRRCRSRGNLPPPRRTRIGSDLGSPRVRHRRSRLRNTEGDVQRAGADPAAGCLQVADNAGIWSAPAGARHVRPTAGGCPDSDRSAARTR